QGLRRVSAASDRPGALVEVALGLDGVAKSQGPLLERGVPADLETLVEVGGRAVAVARVQNPVLKGGVRPDGQALIHGPGFPDRIAELHDPRLKSPASNGA